MKFDTKLWKRSQKSYATTIPHVALFNIDESKHYDVLWEYNSQLGKWTIDFVEQPDKKVGRPKVKK